MNSTAEEDRSTTIARIRDRIASLIEKHFAEGAERYYLSQLGNELDTDRFLLEKMTHGKLADFVRGNFDYEIGRTGTFQNVLYLLPQKSSYIATAARKATIPRYISKFWAAFVVPLSEGERRYIDIHSLDFGSDETEVKIEGADVREIDTQYIVSAESPKNAAAIASCIDLWLQDQKLDRAQFLSHRPQEFRALSSSLLEQLLTALDQEQLKRVSLPLDIVRTLSERRIR